MPQRQLKGLLDGITEQYHCPDNVLEVIETLTQHLTGDQIDVVVKDLADREVVKPVEVRGHSWLRQVLLNDYGAVIINNTGRLITPTDGLILLQDYEDLLRVCDQRGLAHDGNPSSGSAPMGQRLDKTADVREAVVFELTFRSDGYHLLCGRELTNGNRRVLTKALIDFDPYNNRIFSVDEL